MNIENEDAPANFFYEILVTKDDDSGNNIEILEDAWKFDAH